MKKFLILICLFALSCSDDNDANEELCCDKTIDQLIAEYNEFYPRILENDLSDEQRASIEREYEYALENPCEQNKMSLANNGAPCTENP